MCLGSLPRELFLLVCNHLNIADLNALARTCSSLASLSDPLLYQQAVKSGAYKSKFMFSAIHGQSNAVSKFLKAGVSMSAFDDCDDHHPHYHKPLRAQSDALRQSIHPLLAAAYFGNIDVARMLLIEGNANVNFQDKTRRTALRYAIERDYPEIIKLLLEQGTAIEEIDYKYLQSLSPIVSAACDNNKNALELIFNELRARSNKLELRGARKVQFFENIKRQCETACWRACIKGSSDSVEVLLQQGVDVNLCVKERRLLYWAGRNKQVSTVQLLVKYGAKMEHERDCGIVHAMYVSHVLSKEEECQVLSGIVIYLLRSGCNVANGGIHACALWFMANLRKSEKLDREFGTRREREEIKSLLLKYGFNTKKCRHNCWKARGITSLEERYFGGEWRFRYHIEDHFVRNWERGPAWLNVS